MLLNSKKKENSVVSSGYGGKSGRTGDENKTICRVETTERKTHTLEARNVTVIRSNRKYKPFLITAILGSSSLFKVERVLTRVPMRNLGEVGCILHLDILGSYRLEETADRFCWYFVNYSFKPKALDRSREDGALSSIEVLQKITPNYTIKYELSKPLDCLCERDLCKGRIRGFWRMKSDVLASSKVAEVGYVVNR